MQTKILMIKNIMFSCIPCNSQQWDTIDFLLGETPKGF